MSTRRLPHPTAIALTVSALLGIGILAGCTSGGNGSASTTASAPAAAPPTARATPAGSSGRSPGAAAGLSAAALLSAARAALTAGGSVHLDIATKSANSVVTFSDDATASGGRQVITFDGTGHATILLISGVDYVQADAAVLQGFFQATLQEAAQAAGQWISVHPGEQLGSNTYDDITAGITLSSVATELQFGGHLTKAAPATVAGQPVIGVQAPLSADNGLPAGAKMVLYVTDDAALRPVRYELVGGGSTTNELSFSQWGEKLTLTPPAHPIPASSLTSGSVLT
jgi:hypothetical protein